MTDDSHPGIFRVLSTIKWSEEHRHRLIEVFAPAEVRFVDSRDAKAVSRELAECDVAVIRGDMDERYLSAPRLRWVHCDRAGLDKFAPPRLFDTPLIVTSSAGRSGPVLAEHALFFMLALVYRSAEVHRAQRLRRWGLPDASSMRGLFGRRICIVGPGNTGLELARRCLALGMEVVAFRRRSLPLPLEGVRVFSQDAGDRLIDATAGADVLALCASLNDESFHMVGEDEIAAMRPGSFLVNVARAQLVEPRALEQALGSGHLEGVGTDVFDPDEPLPAWHPAWRLRNILITPHVTPQMPDRTQRTLDILAENRSKFLAGEPLRNQLTRRDAFTPPAPPLVPNRRQQLSGLYHRVKRRLLQ
jgi:phosphoglycerate dehydrogenase-like enzyme